MNHEHSIASTLNFCDSLVIPSARFDALGSRLEANAAWLTNSSLRLIVNVNNAGLIAGFSDAFHAAVAGRFGAVEIAATEAESFPRTLFFAFRRERNEAVSVLLWLAHPPVASLDATRIAAIASICDAQPFAICFMGADGRYVYANAATYDSIGRLPGALLGQHFGEFFTVDTVENRTAHRCLEAGLAGNASEYTRERFDHKLQMNRWFQVNVIPDKNARGEVQGAFLYSFDVHDQKRLEVTARRNLKRLERYINSGIAAAFEFDATLKLQWMSQTAEQMFGFSSWEMQGKSGYDVLLVPPEMQQELAQTFINIIEASDGKTHYSRRENVRKDGSRVWCDWYSIAVIDDDSGDAVLICLAVDASDRVAFSRILEENARLDQLTQLPNRFGLKTALATSIPSKSCTIFLIDLDGFKEINDTAGHDVGDQLLIAIAARLRNARNDGEYIARLGGDEFLIYETRALTNAAALERADWLIRSIREPVRLQSQIVQVSASVGVYSSNSAVADAWPSIKFADLAMYQAKARGKNQAVLYTQDLSDRQTRRVQLVDMLRSALASDSLETWFQPQMRVSDCEIVGAEALARWRIPGGEFIPPAEFIPLAEQAGLIHAVGLLTMKNAFRFAAQRNRQPRAEPFIVAINISVLQLQQPSFFDEFRSQLDAAGCKPAWVEIEVTESVQLNDPRSESVLTSLIKQLGVRCSIDDFGTGFSNLGALRNLVISGLKIDRAFIERIVSNHDRVLVAALHGLGKSLGMRVIAEGVETAAQLTALRELGCDLFQGHFVSPAIEAGAFESFLRDYRA